MKIIDILKELKETSKNPSNYSTKDLFEAYDEILNELNGIEETLDSRAFNIAEKVAEATGKDIFSSLDKVEYDGGDEIYVNTSYYHCSSCGEDHKGIYFPKRYMTLSDDELNKELSGITSKRLSEEKLLKEKKEKAELTNKMLSFNKLKDELTEAGVLSE